MTSFFWWLVAVACFDTIAGHFAMQLDSCCCRLRPIASGLSSWTHEVWKSVAQSCVVTLQPDTTDLYYLFVFASDVWLFLLSCYCKTDCLQLRRDADGVVFFVKGSNKSEGKRQGGRLFALFSHNP